MAFTLKRSLFLFFIFFVVLHPFTVLGQEDFRKLLEEARQQAYSKNYNAADELLISYNSSVEDLNGLRLHAQVIYWMKDFSRASRFYKKLYDDYKSSDPLQLEYGRFLYETGKINQAHKILSIYILDHPDDVEANFMLMQINYWNGRMGEAYEIATKMVNHDPSNQDFKNMILTIDRQTAPILRIAANHYTDDQPLEGSEINVTGSWYRSWIFSPTFNLRTKSYSSFNQDYNTRLFSVSNKIFIPSKTTFDLDFGVFKSSALDDNLITGGIQVKQEIYKGIYTSASYYVAPYQYTSISITEPFRYKTTKGAVGLATNKELYAEAGYQQQVFPDNNQIETLYFWTLFPVINKELFNFSTGFSLNYSTSEESTYTDSESSGAPGFPPVGRPSGNESSGFYNGYFTPANQSANGILAEINAGSEKLNLNIKMNWGLFSSADAPVVTATSDIDFYNIEYTPLEISSVCKVKLSNSLGVSAFYNYQSLFFYKFHTGGLQLSYRFF